MSEQTTTNTVSEGKTIAIVSYITLIGLIIAFIMNNDKKNSFARYHIRQSLGLGIFAIALMILSLIPYIGWIIYIVGVLLLLVLWILGLINAANGEEKPLPIVGTQFQEWFKNI